MLDTAELVLMGCGLNPNRVTFRQAIMAYSHRKTLMGGL